MLLIQAVWPFVDCVAADSVHAACNTNQVFGFHWTKELKMYALDPKQPL